MSLLHPEATLTDEGLCRRCDNDQWFEDRKHRCTDPEACSCVTCHSIASEALAVFDALDALLDVSVPKPRRRRRKHRVAARL